MNNFSFSCVWTTFIESCLNDDDRSCVWTTPPLVVFEQLLLSHVWMTILEVVFEQLPFFFFYVMMLLVMIMLRCTHDLESRYWSVFRLTIFFSFFIFYFLFWSCLNDDDNSCVWTTLDLVDFNGCVLTTLMVMTMSAMYEQLLIWNFNNRNSWDVSQE